MKSQKIRLSQSIEVIVELFLVLTAVLTQPIGIEIAFSELLTAVLAKEPIPINIPIRHTAW